MKTIYISGKIAGCDRDEARKKFAKTYENLLSRFVDYENTPHYPNIVNPMAIPDIPDGTWQDYIERDLIYLKHCDTIYMLKDWKSSPGAHIELEVAKKLGMEIIYEEEQQ